MKRLLQIIQSKAMRRFIKIYEPFFYSLCSLIISVLYVIDELTKYNMFREETLNDCQFILSLIGGFSVTTIFRMISHSNDMCKWHMRCLLFNFLVLVEGFLFYFGIINISIYIYSAITFSAIAMLCFFIHLVTNRVKDELCRQDRYLSE